MHLCVCVFVQNTVNLGKCCKLKTHTGAHIRLWRCSCGDRETPGRHHMYSSSSTVVMVGWEVVIVLHVGQSKPAVAHICTNLLSSVQSSAKNSSVSGGASSARHSLHVNKSRSVDEGAASSWFTDQNQHVASYWPAAVWSGPKQDKLTFCAVCFLSCASQLLELVCHPKTPACTILALSHWVSQRQAVRQWKNLDCCAVI